ncbi:hypothetical protein V5799_029389 [Amblyomma americanum]|uniref:SAP domain-containing protein n=1 Tax=Amblyomma americanum TaxID=6943 RepID=A0AAQ4ERG4_AMBAM
MAQPTGSAEEPPVHGEREGITERTRTPSVSSESTFIWSPAKSADRHVLNALRKQRLVDELRTRGLLCTGRKDDLVTRLLDDNTRLQAPPGTSDSTTSQDEKDSHGHGEADSKAPAAIDMLRAEVDELRRLLTQQRHELGTKRPPNVTRGVRAPAAAATQGPIDADRGTPPQSSPENDASTAPEGTPSLNRSYGYVRSRTATDDGGIDENVSASFARADSLRTIPHPPSPSTRVVLNEMR